MKPVIELVLETKDGIIDCRLEFIEDEARPYYAATLLYPTITNGVNRSEIFCYNMVKDGNEYYFSTEDNDIHPKIIKLEGDLSEAIKKENL
jgi:hypothetical protein